MTDTTITQFITDSFPGVETGDNYGYKFFFYGADRMRPFASLATADYDYDRFSNLSRPGVFRLNLGIRKATFEELFGAAGVRPGAATWPTVQRLLAEAHDLARKRQEAKTISR